MKKRILAVLLVLAMIVVAGVVAVSATTPAANGCPVHENCTAEWTEWTYEAGTKVIESGHYYLTAPLEGLSAQFGIGDAENVVDVVLDLRGHNVTSSVRAFYVYPQSTFTLMDSTETPGTVTAGDNSATGSVLYVDTGVEEALTTLNLYNVTVTSTSTGTTNNGGTIYASNYAKINIHGATINAGKAKFGGGIYMTNYGEINMDSGLITGGYAGRGGNIWLGASTMRISGGTISDGESNKAADSSPSYGGGNILMNSGSSKLFVSGTAEITGGTNTASNKDANRGGGNIYLQGTMTMTGGTISDGSTNASGGNILVRGTFNMSGGTISGGSAMAEETAGGGSAVAVRNKDGIVNISGGEISGGTVSIVREDSPNGSFTLSGNPVIDELVIINNTTGYTLTIGENGLTDGARIGVNAAEGAAFTAANENAADYAEYFHGTNFRSKAEANAENQLVLVANNECPHCDAEDIVWVPLTEQFATADQVATEEGNTFHYYLANDITATKRIRITYTGTDTTTCGNVILDLYGHTWTRKSTENAFWVRGGNFDILDSVGGGKIRGNAGNGYQGGIIYQHNDVKLLATTTLHSGTLEYYGTGTKNGGVIYASSGDVYIKGGTITGGKAVYDANKTSTTGFGGSIYLTGASTQCYVSGGTITGGTCANSTGGGGNIYVNNKAKLYVSGNAIIEEGARTSTTTTAHRGGGNIYNNGGTLEISGGIIRNGHVAKDDAGANVHSRNGSITISGGQIAGGTFQKAGSGWNTGVALYDTIAIISGDASIDHVGPGNNGWKTLTISGTPTIGKLDVATKSGVITLGANGVTGGSITVNAEKGAVFTVASEKAEASMPYIHNVDEKLELVLNDDNTLVFNAAVPKPIEEFCEHCGEEAGKQTWLPLTNDSYTATGTGATLPNGHYYLPADLSNANRVNLSEGKICLDLHGKTLTATNIMPFWVKGGDLAIMDTVGGGELQGAAGKGYGGGVIRLTAGVATVYGGTLRYVGTRGTDDGGIVYNYDATFNMNGGHLADGKTVGRGGVLCVTGEGVVNINGGTMELGTAADGSNGICLVNNDSTLNVDADATEALEVLDGNVIGAVASPINMPYGIGLATVYAEATDRCTWYADAADAMAAYDETVNYLKVLGNTGDLDLNGGAYFVDLAGNSIAIENGTVYGMDSANDSFDASACGIANVEAPATYCVAPNGYIYIAVEGENGFTFHRLRMAFERLSLRPGVAGVYYSSSWRGDEVLTGTVSDMQYETESMITGYGMALKKNSAATGESFENGDKFAYTFFDNVEGIASNFLANKNGKEINSCLLSNIINAENGAEINDQNAQVMIYATPYIAFVNYEGNTEYVMGPAYGNNLYGIAKYVIDTIAAMEDADARAKNVNKISALETFADACGVTFEGLTDLIHPTEPAPEETTAPTVAE